MFSSMMAATTTSQSVTMKEPVATLLQQFGLPVSSETVQLAESVS